MTKVQIDKLLSFLPGFEDMEREFGDMKISNGHFPYCVYDDDVEKFNQAIYDDDWPVPSYDWSKDQEMIMDDEAIAKADIMDIRKMLTIFVRKERFCEGIQMQLLRQGRVQAVLKRLATIADES